MGEILGKDRILIIDDDKDDFILTRAFVKDIAHRQFQVDWCPYYDQALEKIRNREYDLYLVDFRLGAKTGLDLLEAALRQGCEEPIVLLTGKGNYKVDLQAMEMGATDYLVKTELSVEKMERCIRYALDRSRNLRELRASERKFRNLFEKSRDLVFIAGSNLDFREVNPIVFPFLGYHRQEMLNMNLLDFIEKAQHRRFLSQSLANKRLVEDWEVELKARSGEVKMCILTASMEEDLEGSAYIQGIVHDMTNLRKMEKSAMLAEKLASAGRLVRTLAHEVRNPLNNISLSIEQLQQESADESSSLYLEIIQRNCLRINSLLTELLNTSRPGETELRPCAIEEVLNGALAAIEDRLTLQRIELRTRILDPRAYILADAEKLVLALLNVLVNAIEAMQDKSETEKGILELAAMVVGDKCHLEIIDNGVGISEEHVGRLFEPDFTHKRNGLGMGLAFTLNIIHAHQGMIDVDSQLGKGTRFVIQLPLYQAAAGSKGLPFRGPSKL